MSTGAAQNEQATQEDQQKKASADNAGQEANEGEQTPGNANLVNPEASPAQQPQPQPQPEDNRQAASQMATPAQAQITGEKATTTVVEESKGAAATAEIFKKIDQIVKVQILKQKEPQDQAVVRDNDLGSPAPLASKTDGIEGSQSEQGVQLGVELLEDESERDGHAAVAQRKQKSTIVPSFTVEKVGAPRQDAALDYNDPELELQPISDKLFYKEMAKIKENSKQAGGGIQPPKKSASAYIIFQKEKRPEILRQNPKAKVTEVVKEIARCWSLMSKEDRMVYKMEAKRDKERYERELKQLESQSKTIKKPKKCLSAYMIFVKETRPKIVASNPNMGALEVMQEVGRAWQNMNEHDRKYFKDKADNDKHRYLAESRKFYDEVARIGIQNTADQAEQMANKSASMAAGGSGKETAKGGGHQMHQQHQSMAAEEGLAGKKRLANAAVTKNRLQRSSSMTGASLQGTAGTGGKQRQVMAIGLAPSSPALHGANKYQESAQKRLRAESKFTFKPDELSEDNGEDDRQQNGSQQLDFENEEDEDDDEIQDDQDDPDGLSQTKQEWVSFNQGHVPETALQFFAVEFRPYLEQDFAQLRPAILKQAIKRRWNELTMKQKYPFEQLQHMAKAKKDEKTATRSRNAKQQAQAAALISISQLSRANQKLAKDTLTVPQALAQDLQSSLEQQQHQNRQENNDSPGGANQDNLIKHSQGVDEGGVPGGPHQKAQMGGPNELELGVNNGQNMIDMDVLSAQRANNGLYSGNNNAINQMNRCFNNTQASNAQTSANSANNLTLQNQQQYANQAALNAQLLNQYLNPLQATNFMQNNTQNSLQHNLLAHQNSGDGLDFNMGGNPGGGLDQQLQQQQQQILAAQLASGANPQQQAAMNQQQQLLLMNLAQINPYFTNNFINQQAAALQQQLQQQQAPQQQAALLSHMALFGKMSAAMGGGGGPGQLNAFGMFDGSTAGQTSHTGMMGYQKQMETPQFAGMTAEIDNEYEINNLLPTAAQQPMTNLPYLTNTGIEEQLGGGFTSSGLQPAQATPVTTAALGGMAGSLFPPQDFTLPASAHTSPFQLGVNQDAAAAALTSQQQLLFGPQDNNGSNKAGIVNPMLQHTGVGQNPVTASPQFSPQLRPSLNQNEVSNADQSNQKMLMWSHSFLNKNTFPKNNSSANMLQQQTASAQKAFGGAGSAGAATSANNGNLNQTNPSANAVTNSGFMNPLKDQQTVQQNLYGATNGAGNNLAANTSNNDLQLNSTSVTPYLKPTARNPDPPMQHVLSSPFMKGIGAPQAHYPTLSFGTMLGGPSPHLGQPAISPLHPGGGSFSFNNLSTNNQATNNGQQQSNAASNGTGNANASGATGTGGNGANGGGNGSGAYGTLLSTGQNQPGGSQQQLMHQQMAPASIQLSNFTTTNNQQQQQHNQHTHASQQSPYGAFAGQSANASNGGGASLNTPKDSNHI